MIHVHVRDAQGLHLLDAGAYRDATHCIRQRVAERLIIQITTEAAGRYGPEEQEAVLRATKPEAASLALREFLPSAERERAFAALMAWMARERIIPQIILYTPEEADLLSALFERGLMPWPSVPVLYVLGRYAADQQSSPADLLPFLSPTAPRFEHWSVCAFGEQEAACTTAGALLGGHVRVGFENNLHLPDGSPASDNSALVETVARSVSALDYALSNADELRSQMLRILGEA